MPAFKRTLYIEQGATFSKYWRKKVGGEYVDYSGYTGKIQIRQGYEGQVLFEGTTEDGTLTLNDQPGKVLLVIPDEDTATLPANNGLVYDIILMSGGLVYRFVEGSVVVSQRVTHV